MLNLYYDEIVGNIEEDERNKFLMVDDYTLDYTRRIIIHQTNNRIDIEKLDETNTA